VTRLPVSELSGERFAPFGAVLEQPAAPQEASGPGWRWWAEVAALPPAEPGTSIGFLDLEPAPARFDWAERHMRTPEVVIPLGGDCLLYAGPAEHPDEPGRMPPLNRFRVFRVRSDQAVVLAPGVWHGAPLAVGGPLRALVLLRTGTGSEDTAVVRFPDTPVEIDHADR
jgi:ureidoglycolate hydrolase